MIRQIKSKVKSGKNFRLVTNVFLTIAFIIVGTKQSKAQLSGSQAIYFQNQYLANPAMAGLGKGFNLNLGYQQQWTHVPGSPKLQSLTADFNVGDRVGLGINVNNDQAGLINRTRVMGTYAYHLPINAEDKLNFGLSFGVNNTYIDYSMIVGDKGDVSPQNFNNRSIYFDGDLGIAYTSPGLNLQATAPNLKNVFFKDEDRNNNLEVDRSTFFTALSYKIPVINEYVDYTVEPKVALRGIKGFQNVFDVGLNVRITDYGIDLSGIYHVNQNATLAFGLDLKTVGFLFAYTNNTAPLNTYANNAFEIGLKFKAFDK